MAQWNKDAQAYRVQDTTNFEVVMLADQNGNPLNSYGSAANIPISAGDLAGYQHINKFGYANDIAAQGGAFVTIWDGGTAYSYASTATIATVTSSSGTDAGAVIRVYGLDENYNDVYEDITIGGAAGQQLFLRVFRAYVYAPAAGQDTNVGEITISVDSAARAIIQADAGQTLMAVYTVPAGKTAYLLKVTCSVDKQTGALFRLRIKNFGNGFQTKGQFGTFGTYITLEYPVPLKFTEKTDIEILGSAGNTCGGGATFDLILVDN